uniref:Uncharacterized protein n=1 Tax=Anguilla anguilla TaxID=7936 RepID=A0A0E9PCN1_ANGAN
MYLIDAYFLIKPKIHQTAFTVAPVALSSCGTVLQLTVSSKEVQAILIYSHFWG